MARAPHVTVTAAPGVVFVRLGKASGELNVDQAMTLAAELQEAAEESRRDSLDGKGLIELIRRKKA